MRVISPRGELINVSRVTAMCEADVTMNGKTKTIIEACEDGKRSTATGLLMQIADNRADSIFANNIYIGNLEPSKLKEIMEGLLTRDFFDLTVLGAEFKNTPFNNRIGCDFPVFWCRNVAITPENFPMFVDLPLESESKEVDNSSYYDDEECDDYEYDEYDAYDDED